MGILFLPSLEEKKFIKIENVSQTEAERLCEFFTQETIASRKLKDSEQEDTDLIIYKNSIDHERYEYNFDTVYDNEYDSADYEIALAKKLFDLLAVSEIKGTRGARAIFVSLEDVDSYATLGVGTTVIYNKNWATINFRDDTLLDRIEDDYDSPAISPDDDDEIIKKTWAW